MRSMVEGPFPSLENPSTALRAVPLPAKSRGGIWLAGFRAERAQSLAAT